jgi:hypothetical protein
MYSSRKRVENYNYHKDNRVNVIDQSSFLSVDEDNMVADVIMNDECIGTIHVRYEVCPTCDGRGKHVNPSIDAHGIPQRRFDRDPQFAREYHSGMYDQACNECDGERVVPRPDPRGSDEEEVYEEYMSRLEAKRDHMRERAAERAMGA